MSMIYEFFKGFEKTIASIARKVGTFLVFIFILGMAFGFFIGTNRDPIFLAGPVVSMAIMYYNLDWGVILFIAAMIAALFL
ncbi:MAG: hypothetical protein WC602_02990 [archaeon]